MWWFLELLMTSVLGRAALLGNGQLLGLGPCGRWWELLSGARSQLARSPSSSVGRRPCVVTLSSLPGPRERHL